MTHDIRPISAAETRPLRHQILRPHQRPEELVYPGDDNPIGLHAGAFESGRLVGIATVSPEACPATPERPGWRLRGMAALPEVQRRGYGAALIAACVEHMRRHGGEVLWCNGRTSAMAFYTALGFAAYGDVFESPGTGPHYVFWREVSVGG
jgi:GNAT superfamily N-acetyltransferase